MVRAPDRVDISLYDIQRVVRLSVASAGAPKPDRISAAGPAELASRPDFKTDGKQTPIFAREDAGARIVISNGVWRGAGGRPIGRALPSLLR